MQHLQATERTHIPHVYVVYTHSTELSSALLPIFLTGRALAHAWTAQESEGQRVVELCGGPWPMVRRAVLQIEAELVQAARRPHGL